MDFNEYNVLLSKIHALEKLPYRENTVHIEIFQFIFKNLKVYRKSFLYLCEVNIFPLFHFVLV